MPTTEKITIALVWHWPMAMHHRLKWFIHLRAQGLQKGDEHPAYGLLWDKTLYLTLHTQHSLQYTVVVYNNSIVAV